MPHQLETQLLAKRLKGQKLVIPDLKPIFSHWPSLANENYGRMKDMVDRKLPQYGFFPIYTQVYILTLRK
jgi:hypothetical protein